MGIERPVYRVLLGRPVGKLVIGRSRQTLEDNIKQEEYYKLEAIGFLWSQTGGIISGEL